MAADEIAIRTLNEQQVLMLRLFKEPLSAEDFLQIRRLAVKLLSKKMDKVVSQWEAENELDAAAYETLSKTHFDAAK